MTNTITYPEQYYQRVKVTPLVRYQGPSNWRNIWLKDETQQVARSFKIRGTFNRLLREPVGKTVVTASTGNLALGVALTARELGLQARVFMPGYTSRVKADAISELGATLVLVDGSYEDCVVEALRFSDEADAPYISSLNDSWIVQGQASLFQEITRQFPGRYDAVFVPVGGGGLLAGCLLHLQGSGIKIVGAELESVPSMHKALATGHRPMLPPATTIAEGMLVRQAGELPFEMAREYPALEMVQVSEEQIKHTMSLLWHYNAIRAEGAGAAALAAALAYAETNPEQQIAAVISGGNVDEALFQQVITEDAGALKK